MKAKTTLLIQTIGMYLMQLPLFVLLITLAMPMDPDFQESFHRGLMIAALVMLGLMIPISILNAVVSVSSAVKGKEDPTKATMVAKLALIPWYLVNVAVCFVFSSIFFNPFMMFAIPSVIALFVVVTYALMLTTSLGDVAYFVKKKIRKDESVTTSTVLRVICLFLFCLDVLGAILLYRQFGKVSSKEPSDSLDETTPE